ncbi:hypothetical protein LAWASA_4462 [Lawsonibacter asaccharolyticus]|nr:hypothetical protein LAWASA_4462 [Lawsonibacter asaccharolyticus]
MELADEMNENWRQSCSAAGYGDRKLADGMFPRRPEAYEQDALQMGECEMELDQATEQFYEKRRSV